MGMQGYTLLFWFLPLASFKWNKKDIEVSTNALLLIRLFRNVTSVGEILTHRRELLGAILFKGNRFTMGMVHLRSLLWLRLKGL